MTLVKANLHTDDREYLFNELSTKNISHIFKVENEAVLIRAFGMDKLDELLVEMVHDMKNCRQIVSPYCPSRGQVYLDSERNVLVLGIPGRYRLVMIRKDNSKPNIGTLIVTKHYLKNKEQLAATYLNQKGLNNES